MSSVVQALSDNARGRRAETLSQDNSLKSIGRFVVDGEERNAKFLRDQIQPFDAH